MEEKKEIGKNSESRPGKEMKDSRRTKASLFHSNFILIRPPKKESTMGVEIEVNRLVSDNDECPYCNGMGKLTVPGAPDCPHCKGMGVMEVFLHGYPNHEAKVSGKSQNFR